MKSQLIVATIVALAASPANAAAVTGRIRSINQFANTATLDDGDTFFLGKTIAATDLQVGELVKITYRGIGSSKRALAVQPAN